MKLVRASGPNVRRNIVAVLVFIFINVSLACSESAFAGVERRVFVDRNRNQILKLEWLENGLLRFEWAHDVRRLNNDPIYSSIMIKPQEFKGPTSFSGIEETFLTPELKVWYRDGCFGVQDFMRKKSLANVCAENTHQAWKTLVVETSDAKNIYGLGQIFEKPGSMIADRQGKVIGTRGDYGNNMPGYAGGATGEALFPMVTVLGTGTSAWGFVLDNVYKQTWDFSRPTWQIGMHGDQIRGYFIVGASPLEVRKRYMNLTGKAPVPPRKMFGFWMSEYGYDHWDEIEDRLAGMRRDGFPIDGFFLDLQWFGNVVGGSDHTRMGSLQFDEASFPRPEETIKKYLDQEDIGLITIEESYIGRALPEHETMESRGFLAHECGYPYKASYLTGDVTGNASEWWGRGGMIDWSNPHAARFWHNTKRQNLIRMGIFGHWLDLGEPEMFDPKSCYFGNGEPNKIQHQDVHNLFSLFWVKSVWDGFLENQVGHRPFSMLRSGNMGLQRFGGGMWSGDIAGNLPSLAAHIASHAHVSWSGIDYYSSDIGGFHRNRVDGTALSVHETQEGFTQWFANATWFDVPVRSHVMNLDNDRSTAPNRIGHVESNRENLRARYSLVPYYYSLAHKSSNDGSPLMEPMPMRFPADAQARKLGDQRMLGQLMMTAAAEEGQYQKNVYLPRGGWYDFYSGLYTESTGSWLTGVPLYRDGLFRLPVFARAGGIVPRYQGQAKQGLGARHPWRESRANAIASSSNMLLDIFVDQSGLRHEFELFEDDGYSRENDRGAVRVTRFEQKTDGKITSVQVQGAIGDFAGASLYRAWVVRIWSPGPSLSEVRVNGLVIGACQRSAQREMCYEDQGARQVNIYLPQADIRLAQSLSVRWNDGPSGANETHFVCDEGRDAPRNQSQYIVGDDPALGSWNPELALPLKRAEFVRGLWTTTVRGLNAGRTLSWKCIRKSALGNDRQVEWQPGENNRFVVGSSGGFQGMAKGRW